MSDFRYFTKQISCELILCAIELKKESNNESSLILLKNL